MNGAIPGKTISLDFLEEMFANINESTEWDMNGDMLWGYFFTHNEPKLLEQARDELVAKGYRFVNLHESDETDQDGPCMWWLHVEKEETHTPESLDARNDELYVFAARHGLDSYDGMDVGPIKN